MIKILFCDDDEVFLHILIDRVREILKQMGEEPELTGCRSGAELLSCLEQTEQLAKTMWDTAPELTAGAEEDGRIRQAPFDALFLDIDMPGMSGFEVAERLGRMKESPLIVFVSQMDHLVYESFSYRPFWFLRKSDLKPLPELLKKLVNAAVKEKFSFSLSSGGKTIAVPLREILYFESHGHYVILHTISDERRYKAGIGEIAGELEPHDFVRCHVGFLVNCRYITAVKKSRLYLQSGEEIAVSRNRQKETERKFMEYLCKAKP